MKLTIRDLIRLRHCESHYRLGKLGLYAASKRTQFFYQKKDSLILALSKGPTSFSEALEKAFLEYSRDWFLNNRQYETCRDQDLARWHRFADWFFEQGYQILKTRLCSAISVNTSCNHVAVSELSAQADLVLKKGEHVYALSIFPNEPQYSVRARKQETQAYYSLELLSQYLISAPAYGQETISMICYLKSKEDKADFLASQYTEGKCYLQMGYGGIAEATQALLSTIQLSVPQKCEYCRYTDVCHQQNTSALAPEKQPEETSIPVPAETSGSPGIALARTLSSCKKLLYAQDLSDAVRSIYQFLWQKKEHPAVEELCSRIEMRAINTASEFLNHMNAMIEFSDTAEVEYPASPDTITLLTAHKSKGKEFPTVVIYGVEEFEESEEGRNLLYVSMTRAKRNLFLLQGSFSDAPLYPEFKNYVD